MKNKIFLAFLFFSMWQISMAQEITQWRGVNSSGIYKVEKLLSSWSAEGPQVLWTFEKLGQGFSSPAFANNKIYINGMIEGQGVLFVLDQNGKELQQFEYGKEFDTSFVERIFHIIEFGFAYNCFNLLHDF